jgi:DNA-binding CsgD family transcriptional regulator
VAPPRATAPDVLTPRERSVLGLVAGGRTEAVSIAYARGLLTP